MRSETHNLLQDSVKKYYMEMGMIAIKEHCVKGKKIDVLVQDIKTKFTIANEIQMGFKHAIENILLDLEVGCDEVRIISVSKRVSEHIKERALKELGEDLLKKVKFHVADELFPHLKIKEIKKNKAEFNPEIYPEENNQEGGEIRWKNSFQ